jgi:hypothetical protein
MYNSDMPSYVVRIFAGDSVVILGIKENSIKKLSIGMK